MTIMETVQFEVNGQGVHLDVEPHWTLLDVLRKKLNLTGTKRGCEMGDCCACTVILNGRVCNACLVLAAELEGSSVLTVEGVAKNDKLHPVQQAFVDHGAIQCGFCTPGMVMSTVALLDRDPNPSEDEVRLRLAGNICRCTGYTKIIEAVMAAAKVIYAGDGEVK
jgi:carbon-monoxide dehydrogenase small subunit